MQRGTGTKRGFTLLEIMIALTLSVVLLGMLTAGMRMVVDEWQDSNSPFESEIETSLILLQLEQALLGATPHSYIDQDTLAQNVFFIGADDSITWVSTVSPQARQEMTAWQLQGGDRDGVRLKTTPAFADDPTERLENATGVVLLPGYDMTVSYLTLDDLDRTDWLEEWDGAEYQELPMAVRLTFSDSERPSDESIELVLPILGRQHETIQPVDVQ